MSKKLYVGNLSFSVTDEDLKELFSQMGTVESANVIMDRETGRSRGFAFVEMSSEERFGESFTKKKKTRDDAGILTKDIDNEPQDLSIELIPDDLEEKIDLALKYIENSRKLSEKDTFEIENLKYETRRLIAEIEVG